MKISILIVRTFIIFRIVFQVYWIALDISLSFKCFLIESGLVGTVMVMGTGTGTAAAVAGPPSEGREESPRRDGRRKEATALTS